MPISFHREGLRFTLPTGGWSAWRGGRPLSPRRLRNGTVSGAITASVCVGTGATSTGRRPTCSVRFSPITATPLPGWKATCGNRDEGWAPATGTTTITTSSAVRPYFSGRATIGTDVSGSRSGPNFRSPTCAGWDITRRRRCPAAGRTAPPPCVVSHRTTCMFPPAMVSRHAIVSVRRCSPANTCPVMRISFSRPITAMRWPGASGRNGWPACRQSTGYRWRGSPWPSWPGTSYIRTAPCRWTAITTTCTVLIAIW